MVYFRKGSCKVNIGSVNSFVDLSSLYSCVKENVTHIYQNLLKLNVWAEKQVRIAVQPVTVYRLRAVKVCQ